MWKSLLSGAALLALMASNSVAGTVNFSWSGCMADGGVQNRPFACDTNVGTHVMVGTFTLDNPMSDFVSVMAIVDLQSQNTLPAWWTFNNPPPLPNCRTTALSAPFDFSILPGACEDPFGQPAQGGLAAYCIQGGPCVDGPTIDSRARIKAAGAIANPTSLEAGVEYYGVRFAITNAKTVGTGSCEGCTDPVCLVLTSIDAIGNSHSEMNTDVPLIGLPGGDFYVTWQGGAVGGTGCPLATPARNRTWGQVKSLYRP